ncbi:MAG: ParB N-terminal domain-containing protein, partial [Oscillospiraceae bacterium]|nr:ParB N-terminal domain-containing protein [Oscillospiraceae bacterium]
MAASKLKIFDAISSAILNEKTVGKVIEIDMDRIYPNPNQPRRIFDSEELEDLAASIKTNGLIQPRYVRRGGVGFER